MSVIAVVGLQYGDEAKSRVADHLIHLWNIRVGVRSNGGANAGHTVVVDGKKSVLHHLPATVLREGTVSVLSPGVLVDLVELESEIGMFLAKDSTVMVDPRCSAVLPEHKERDKATGSRIGTTGRGIGPCMEDRVTRIGYTVGDLVDKYPFIKRHLCDTVDFLHSVAHKEQVIVEGAQAFGLDLWHGTYPYVTSSSCTTGGICAYTGLSPKQINLVCGVCKPYSTRVGKGPFLDMPDLEAEEYRTRGNEYGSTTGRPRRIGYLDLDEAKRAAKINGVDFVALTKTDVVKYPLVVYFEGKFHQVANLSDLLHMMRDASVRVKFVSYSADRSDIREIPW